MRKGCVAHAASHNRMMRLSCHGTGRYGTERKSHQDTAQNRRLSDAAGAVDNRSVVAR